VDTHGAAVRQELMKQSLFQILMLEMFQMDVRTHDEMYLLSYLGLNQGDGSNHCAMIEMVFQEQKKQDFQEWRLLHYQLAV